MRLLAIDIETRPNLAMVWDLWQKGISPSAVTEATEMLCWAAKWIGEKKVEFASVYHDGKELMLKDVWDLLDKADVVVHYNGEKFDVPYMNMEFVRLGWEPPSPYQQVDLLKIVRKKFNFPSNKLAYVSKEFGLGGKVEHEGFPLWIKCMNGDEGAWKRMRTYNIRDVELLEPLYLKLRPWAHTLPSYAAFTGGNVCRACGSPELQRRGYEHTKTRTYQRFQCTKCKAWNRSVKSEYGAGVT